MDGMQISTNAAVILRDKGAMPGETSRELTQELASWADLILTMTTNHKKQVILDFPEAVDKTYTLKEYALSNELTKAKIQEREQWISELQIKKALQQPVTAEDQSRLDLLDEGIPDFDIMDPFGRHLAVYRDCADEIEQAVKKTIEKLVAE